MAQNTKRVALPQNRKKGEGEELLNQTTPTHFPIKSATLIASAVVILLIVIAPTQYFRIAQDSLQFSLKNFVAQLFLNLELKIRHIQFLLYR